MARKSRKAQPLLEEVVIKEPIVKAKYRCGLYGRISLETEENRESGSIETQIELLKNYVNDTEDMVIEDIYTDLSYSGTVFDRPQFTRMIEDAKSGRINCIIVKDLSRLGRNYIETSNYVERVFPFLNIRFIAVVDDFDSFRPGTDLMMPLKNIVNDYYSKDISKKVATAIRAQWEAGYFHGPIVPYGYRKMQENKNMLEVDPVTCEYVKRIFQMFLEGSTYTQIARTMNAEKVYHPDAYRKTDMTSAVSETEVKWDSRQVKRILEDQHYLGDYIHGKNMNAIYKGIKNLKVDKKDWICIRGIHTPIISKEDFKNVQERIAELNKKYCNRKGKGTYREKNVFTGKIKCADCGKGLQMRYEKGKWFYQCNTYVKDGKAACKSHVVLYKVLSNEVLTVIRSHMKACLDNQELIRKLNAKAESAAQYDLFTKEITKCRLELQKMRNYKAGLYQDYTERLITEAEYLKLNQDLGKKIDLLEQKLEELLKAQVYYAKSYHIDEDWAKVIETYRSKRLLSREMVDAFVEKITVNEDGTFEVKLYYDDMLREMEVTIKERCS